MDKIIVGIAEAKTAQRGQVLISYALGSCVGVCLYDSKLGIAGMAHVVLPKNPFKNQEIKNIYKYADVGVHALVHMMCDLGCDRQRLQAKLAGGARMFDAQGPEWEIGRRNVDAVKLALQREQVPVAKEDTGKNYGRTLYFYGDDGRLEVRTVRNGPVVL